MAQLGRSRVSIEHVGLLLLVTIAACGGSTPPAQEPTAAPSATPAEPARATTITESMGTMPREPAPTEASPAASAAAPAAPPPRAPPPDHPSGSTFASSSQSRVSQAESVVAQLRPQFRNCYQHALNNDPSMSGVVTVKLTHDKAGTITKVEFPCGPLPPEFAACMRKIYMGREGMFDSKGETTFGPACPAKANAK